MRLYFELLRPRTWFLSLAGVAQGAFLVLWQGQALPFLLFLLSACCALSLQIVSNLGNDLGDEALDADRSPTAPRRLLALGCVTRAQVKRLLGMFITLALLSGWGLLFVAQNYGFAILGLSSLAAALLYSLTPYAYGRAAGGEIAVFLFFGLLAVAGSAYLFTQRWHHTYFLLGSSWGSASALVLYLNNLRDADSDRRAGKITLAQLLPCSWRKRFAWFLLGAHVLALWSFLPTFALCLIFAPAAWALHQKRFHALLLTLHAAPLFLFWSLR